MRRYLLVPLVLGVSLFVASGSGRAGWYDHSGASDQGESMSSESSTPATEEGKGSYDNPGEWSGEIPVYRAEEPRETGRVPETGNPGPDGFVVYERSGELYRQGIDDGP